jgi:hypothetical protein
MELVNRFAQVRGDLLATVSGFPEDKLEEAVCGEWDIKGVLAHIAGWDTYFTAIVRLLRAGEDVPFRGDRIEGWNEALVKEREGRAWSEVRDEFEREGEGFLEEYRRLEGDLWSRRFWAQRNPTPAWVVEHNTGHYAGHLDEIRQKLREWEG